MDYRDSMNLKETKEELIRGYIDSHLYLMRVAMGLHQLTAATVGERYIRANDDGGPNGREQVLEKLGDNVEKAEKNLGLTVYNMIESGNTRDTDTFKAAVENLKNAVKRVSIFETAHDSYRQIAQDRKYGVQVFDGSVSKEDLKEFFLKGKEGMEKMISVGPVHVNIDEYLSGGRKRKYKKTRKAKKSKKSRKTRRRRRRRKR